MKFDKIRDVEKRYEDLTEKMANPDLYNKKEEFRAVSNERAKIEDLVFKYREYVKVYTDLENNLELLKNEKDPNK